MYHAHGHKMVIAQGLRESAEHVLMKICLWALYLPQYPDLTVEIRIEDRYKPDVVQLDLTGRPIFWGESGQVSVKKIESLARRYRDTHFAIAKWAMRLDPLEALVREAVDGIRRGAPFDLISIPPDALTRFIDAEGRVSIGWGDVERVRIEG
ncbi:MAG: hypothetical protein IPK19_26065 [Chloroflexi bacterium]|nr:hypothetical protein [Chloroflexota bacterium]